MRKKGKSVGLNIRADSSCRPKKLLCSPTALINSLSHGFFVKFLNYRLLKKQLFLGCTFTKVAIHSISPSSQRVDAC